LKPFAIIIPHYGEDALLNECLDALSGWDEWFDCVHVVDDNADPSGFTRACNRALLQEMQTPTGEHILLLNNDCVPLENPFAPLQRRLEQKDVGIAAPMNVAYDDHDHIIWGGSGSVFPGRHKTGSRRLGQWTEATRERWATFSVVAFKREMVQRIGLLDERFVNICSDSDYCFRARARGWQVWYEAESIWAHRWGLSREIDRRKEVQKYRDAWRLREKWGGDLHAQLAAEV